MTRFNPQAKPRKTIQLALRLCAMLRDFCNNNHFPLLNKDITETLFSFYCKLPRPLTPGALSEIGLEFVSMIVYIFTFTILLYLQIRLTRI